MQFRYRNVCIAIVTALLGLSILEVGAVPGFNGGEHIVMVMWLNCQRFSPRHGWSCWSQCNPNTREARCTGARFRAIYSSARFARDFFLYFFVCFSKRWTRKHHSEIRRVLGPPFTSELPLGVDGKGESIGAMTCLSIKVTPHASFLSI